MTRCNQLCRNKKFLKRKKFLSQNELSKSKCIHSPVKYMRMDELSLLKTIKWMNTLALDFYIGDLDSLPFPLKVCSVFTYIVLMYGCSLLQ